MRKDNKEPLNISCFIISKILSELYESDDQFFEPRIGLLYGRKTNHERNVKEGYHALDQVVHGIETVIESVIVLRMDELFSNLQKGIVREDKWKCKIDDQDLIGWFVYSPNRKGIEKLTIWEKHTHKKLLKMVKDLAFGVFTRFYDDQNHDRMWEYKFFRYNGTFTPIDLIINNFKQSGVLTDTITPNISPEISSMLEIVKESTKKSSETMQSLFEKSLAVLKDQQEKLSRVKYEISLIKEMQNIKKSQPPSSSKIEGNDSSTSQFSNMNVHPSQSSHQFSVHDLMSNSSVHPYPSAPPSQSSNHHLDHT